VLVRPKVYEVGVVAPTAVVRKIDTMLRIKSAVMNSAANFAGFLRFIGLSVFFMLYVLISLSLLEF